MADFIISVQTLNLEQSTDSGSLSGSAEIVIPSREEVLGSWGNHQVGSQYWPGDAVTYVFDGSNSQDLELVQSGSTEGIRVLQSTEKTTGPWRLAANPPNRVFLPVSGSDSVRVTVVLSR